MRIKKIQNAVPETEAERLRALREYEIADGKIDEELNDLVKLASEICQTPISLVTLLDEDRQWFKGAKGVDITNTSRDIALCNFTILQNDLLEVEDVTEDERFRDHPFVRSKEDHVRFYAGVPLTNKDGYNLGSLCVVHTQPHQLNDFQKRSLKTLARQVVRKLDFDLSQKRLSEHARSLKKANAKLQKLSRLNVNLLSAMAHDLRNNLSSGEAVLTLIKDRVDLSDDLQMLVGEQLKGLNQSYKLLSDMVAWGSSYTRSGEINKEQVQPAEVIDVVLTDLSDFARRKDVTLRNLTPQYVTIETDPEMLKFIVRNLVQNALKFSNDGSVVVDFDQQNRTFTVADQGRGMNDKRLVNLFSWDRTKVREGTDGEPGSGIGLMLCKDFVDRHDGEIWAESTEGKGTTFYFTLEPKA